MEIVQHPFEKQSTTRSQPAMLDEGSRLFPLAAEESLAAEEQTPEEATVAEEKSFEPRWWPGRGFNVD